MSRFPEISLIKDKSMNVFGTCRFLFLSLHIYIREAKVRVNIIIFTLTYLLISINVTYNPSMTSFYIYPPPPISQRAVLLLPSRQVEHFFLTINKNLGTRLALPEDAVEAGFLVDFPEDGMPRPRYLGRSTEREMAEALKQSVPSRTYKPDGEPELTVDPTDKSLEAFKRKMELLVQNDKKRKAVVKEKKRAERLQKQQSWNRIVKRVQRYLGIREAYRGQHNTTKTTGESLPDAHLGQCINTLP
jgi:hypothetical protein